jgi:coproporphyrinogen III oxidase-like Fe-S oxidoreductase
MSAGTGEFVASSRVLNRDEIAGEFMMNALRLNDGFTLSQFVERTGLSSAQLEPQLELLCQRELLVCDCDVVKATETGRRFLDSVIAEFFPG